MSDRTFAELSAPPPWSWDGAYAAQGWTWFDDVCPPQVAHQCVKPGHHHPPIPQVPEPSSALLLAIGLIAVYIAKRKRT